MGMSYDIIPDKPTVCENDFGEGLSFFFEQVEGYGETAEVEQVSKILQLDLSVFQDINYNYNKKKDVEKHWHDINIFSALVDSFINAILAKPDFYMQVHHNPDIIKQQEDEQKIWRITDTTERSKQLDELRKQPFYYYPPDHGYLSQGRLLKDLQTLKNTLECYKKNGVTKIRLQYT